MKSLAFAIFLGACTSVHASTTITEEFVQVLKDNAKDKASGTQDPKQFFVKANEFADKGDPSAQFLIGLILLKADPKTARLYLSSSAKSGCAGSEAALGLLDMLSQNFTGGVKHYQLAAARGESSAQVALSGLHERGEHGLEASLPKAYAWLLIAERQTASAGALLAIKNGKSRLEKKMSPVDIAKANEEFADLKDGVPKISYYFCGQTIIDSSLAPDVPYYYKIQ